MPSRHLGRCDGHHEMVDCIGPLSDPEGSGQRPLLAPCQFAKGHQAIGHKPTCVPAPPLLICVDLGRTGQKASWPSQNGGQKLPCP